MQSFHSTRKRSRMSLIAVGAATALLASALTAAPASAAEIQTAVEGTQPGVTTAPITTEGAAGPITTYSCNLLHCTVLLSRAQTKQMATGSAAAGAVITAICGPAAWACAIAVGLMVGTANRAKNQGRCAGIRRLTTSPPVWPVIEPCRQ